MSFKKKFLGAGLITVMSLGFATGALADTQTGTSEVNANIQSGGFDLAVSDLKAFDDITIKNSDDTYSTGFEDVFTVKDLRGLDDDWELTVESSTFQSVDNAAHKYENVLSISPLENIERKGNTVNTDVPTIGETGKKVLDDGEVSVAYSSGDNGLGEFDLTFPEEAVHLDVTPDMKEGTYEATLTWNLKSVPQ